MIPENRMTEKRNELFTDLMSLVERQLRDHEIEPNVASVIASSMADHLADHWGGQNICFPKDFRWKLSRLELEIYDKFHGNNFDTLALEYNLTDRGMRKLIKRVRAKLVSRSQSGLFDTPEHG